MTTRNKILIVLGIGILLAIMAIIVKYLYDINERQKAIETSVVQMKQLQDGTVRSESVYATKDDLEKFAKSSGIDLKPIRDDLEKLDAKIVGISRVGVRTIEIRETNVRSTSTTPNAAPATVACVNGVCKDEHGYRSNTQYLDLGEAFGGARVPFGQAGFSAWKPAPWSIRVYPRTYSVNTVVSRDAEGRTFLHHKFVITIDGKKYTAPISESKFVEEYPMARFHLDPALFLTFGAGHAGKFEMVGGLEFSLLSYGVTKDKPTFSLVNVGFGYLYNSKQFGILFTPIYWNIRGVAPIVENTYIGPGVSIGLGGDIGFYGKIGVQF